MSPSPALNKVFLTRKLSTEAQGTLSSVPETHPPFDPRRLINELLSLGNDKITAKVAETIGQEVQAELKRRSAERWSAELISEIVRFKLEELGLIEIRRRRRAEGVYLGDFHRLPRGILKEGSAEEWPLPPSSSEDEWTQPLAELPLRRPPTASPNEAPVVSKPLPPRAGLPVSETFKQSLAELFPHSPEQERTREWEESLTRVAREISQAETKFADTADPDLIEIEFFNVMANQEFLPHHPLLLSHGSQSASGTFWARLPLTAEIRSQAEALEFGRKIWESGGSVLFEIEDGGESRWNPEILERFLAGVERILLQLPDGKAMPCSVGFSLTMEDSQTPALAKLILSGRYYPSFTLHFRFGGESLELSAEIQSVLKETWKKGEPSLVLTATGSETSQGPRAPTSAAATLAKPTRVYRPGGGPALDPLEVCQLGSLNLSILASGKDVDWVKLRRILKTAVHFLDNWIEAGPYATEEIARNTQANRKIGMGVMGFAELLVKLGIPYDSDAGVMLAEKLMRFVYQETLAASEALAQRRGTFSNFALSLLPHPHLRPRNASLTAVVVAPFLAAVTGVTPGLEPLPTVVTESSPESRQPIALLKQIGLKHQVWSAELEADLIKHSSVRGSETAPKPLRRLFGIRAEIGAEWEMKVHAAAQRQCDGSVGSCLDLGESPDMTPLWNAWDLAKDLGFAQISLRSNPALEDQAAEVIAEVITEIPVEEAMSAEPVTVEEEPLEPVEVIVEEAAPPPPLLPRPRADVLNATMRVIQTGCGPMTVALAHDEVGPYELQARLGKAGSCESAQAEAISRLTTLLLGVGVDSRLIHEQLEGIRCPRQATDKGEAVLSCGDAISKVLARELGFSQKLPDHENDAVPLASEEISEDEEITAVANLESLH